MTEAQRKALAKLIVKSIQDKRHTRKDFGFADDVTFDYLILYLDPQAKHVRMMWQLYPGEMAKILPELKSNHNFGLLKDFLNAHGVTQLEIARAMEVSQPRVNAVFTHRSQRLELKLKEGIVFYASMILKERGFTREAQAVWDWWEGESTLPKWTRLEKAELIELAKKQGFSAWKVSASSMIQPSVLSNYRLMTPRMQEQLLEGLRKLFKGNREAMRELRALEDQVWSED